MRKDSADDPRNGRISRLKAFFLREVNLPESPFFRDVLVLALLVSAGLAYHLEDMSFHSLPRGDLAGSMAWFADYKAQWFSEGTLPLWLPTWFTGMLNLHSLTEFLLVFPFSLFMSPVAAYKMVSLVVIAAGAVGVFRLLRHFGIDRTGAFVGGLVFFLHPVVMLESRFFGHLAFLLTLTILPFYLSDLRQVLSEPRRAWPVTRAALLLGLLFSLHVTMAVMVSLMTMMITLLWHDLMSGTTGWLHSALKVAFILVAGFAVSSFANVPLWIESRQNLALFAGGRIDGVSQVAFPVPSPLFFFDRMGVLLAESQGVRCAIGNTPLLMHYPISSGVCYAGWSVFLLTLAGAIAKTREREGHGLFLLAPVWVFMAWLSLGNCSALGSFDRLMKMGAPREAWLALLLSLALAIWAVVLTSRGWKRPDRFFFLKMIGAGVFVAAVAVFPGFPVLQAVIPFFAKIRGPCQFLVPGFVLLPLLVGASVHEIRRRLGSYARMAATAVIGILLLVDFYPYNPASFLQVCGLEWPMLEKATAFLRQEQGRERVIYAEAYSPVMDYALSAMSGKNHFSYWLQWTAPRYTGAYRERVYDAWYRWLITGDPEEWKALMAVANIHFVIVPCFQTLLPPEPALTKVYHNLWFDIYVFKEALGTWQAYPGAAISYTDSNSWGESLLGALRQGRALVDEEKSDVLELSDSSAAALQSPGKILHWQRSASTECWADVEFAQPGILMWSESYHPYWRVQIDGQTSRLLRVNHAFLGVRVPPGKHRIVFQFGPYPWRRLGTAVSLISLAALLLLGYVSSSRGKAHRKGAQHSI